MLGGSLGTGVSNADVTFIKSSVATLENTPDGISKLLSLQKKIAQRKIQVAELARQWKLENNTEFLDDKWETYISKWRRENPVFPDAEDYL
jgi:maltoporin